MTKFIKLTLNFKSRHPVWLNVSRIQSFWQESPGDPTRLNMGGQNHFAVIETPEEIAKIISRNTP